MGVGPFRSRKSPLARACALHLLCRDAGVLHDAGMMVLAGLGACLVVVLVALRVCVLREWDFALRSHKPARACLCAAFAVLGAGMLEFSVD